jgi:hypothetical protein
MRIENLILRLRIKEDNKLSKRRASSFLMTPRVNMVEQVENFYRKNNQKNKLVLKSKHIAKNFNGK